MIVYHNATWKNGKKKLTGKWAYIWSSETFVIYLNSTDSVTGTQRTIVVGGDHPEWGNWKIVEEAT
jgi:hypothetical protein